MSRIKIRILYFRNYKSFIPEKAMHGFGCKKTDMGFIMQKPVF